jgi:hypothetical protein
VSSSSRRAKQLAWKVVEIADRQLSFERAAEYRLLPESDLPYLVHEKRTREILHQGWRRVRARTSLNSLKLDGDLAKRLTDEELDEVEAKIDDINNWHNTLDEILEHCRWLARYLNAKRKEQAR